MKSEKRCDKCDVTYTSQHNVCQQKRLLSDKLDQIVIDKLRIEATAYTEKNGFNQIFANHTKTSRSKETSQKRTNRHIMCHRKHSNA